MVFRQIGLIGPKSARCRHLERRVVSATRVPGARTPYPHLTPGEIDELIAIYKGLSILDISLLAADEDRPEQLERFVEDDYDRLHDRWSDHIPSVLGVVDPLAIIAALIWATAR